MSVEVLRRQSIANTMTHVNWVRECNPRIPGGPDCRFSNTPVQMKVRTSTFVHGACWHRRDVTVLDNSRATRLIEQLCPQCHVVLGGATVELDAIELSCEERVHKTLSGNLAVGEHGIPTETHAPSAQRFTSPMYPGRPLYVSTIGVHPTRHWFISTAATSKSGRDSRFSKTPMQYVG